MKNLDAEKFFENAAADVKKGKKADETGEIGALAAVALYLRHGNNVTAEQAIAIRNAMSTTTPAEGGYTVPAEIATMVVDALKAFGGMREVSQVITTAGGNALNWPTSDGTSEVGEIVAENAAATGAANSAAALFYRCNAAVGDDRDCPAMLSAMMAPWLSGGVQGDCRCGGVRGNGGVGVVVRAQLVELRGHGLQVCLDGRKNRQQLALVRGAQWGSVDALRDGCCHVVLLDWREGRSPL